MNLENITSDEIENLDYNEIIGIVKETNRIPGGRNTLFEIASRCFLTNKSKILEIGTSTGFTSIELSQLINCKIISIDINEISLNEARERAIKEGYENIEFLKADVNNLSFREGEFDLVIIGNVLSLISNKEKAFNECRRVCKKDGFIVAVPMYYIKSPSENLVKEVSKAIKVNITPMYKEDWIKFFETPNFEIFSIKDFKFDYISDIRINSFSQGIFSRPHLKEMSKESFKKLKEIYQKFMLLFRDNLANMGYSIIILSNRKSWEDEELFTSKEVK